MKNTNQGPTSSATPSAGETLFHATVTDLARGGSGVAKLDTGEIVFVPFTCPGDEIEIRITEKSKTYSLGEMVRLITPSTQRVTPPCKVFTQCGGCTWQHIPYDLQFETKKKGLITALNRAGMKDLPVADLYPAQTFYHYRNRIQLHGNSGAGNFGKAASPKVIGYFAKGSKNIVNIERCEIAHEKINAELPEIAQIAFKEYPRDFKVEIELNDDEEIQVAWNQKNASFGFRQIHTDQNEIMKTWVAEAAKTVVGSTPSPEATLLDLYGGNGNLSTLLTAQFSEIHCVDLGAPRANHSTANHFKFHRLPVTTWLRTVDATAFKNKPTTVILDPPREGLGHEFDEIFTGISKFDLNGIILVGCDTDSFARDLQKFTKHGFLIKKLALLDLFPQTPHVESLALLLPSALN